MITVGLIHELSFIAAYLDKEIEALFSIGKHEIKTVVSENKVTIFYGEQTIWKEGIHGEGSWFGVESADVVHKIIKHIDKHGDTSWKEKYRWNHYIETSEEFVSLQTAIDQAAYEKNLSERLRSIELENIKK